MLRGSDGLESGRWGAPEARYWLFVIGKNGRGRAHENRSAKGESTLKNEKSLKSFGSGMAFFKWERIKSIPCHGVKEKY